MTTPEERLKNDVDTGPNTGEFDDVDTTDEAPPSDAVIEQFKKSVDQVFQDNPDEVIIDKKDVFSQFFL